MTTNQMTCSLELEERAREERNAYHRDYRKRNRKRIRETQKKWREENREKISEYNQRYWLKKAEEKEAK